MEQATLILIGLVVGMVFTLLIVALARRVGELEGRRLRASDSLQGLLMRLTEQVEFAKDEETVVVRDDRYGGFPREVPLAPESIAFKRGFRYGLLAALDAVREPLAILGGRLDDTVPRKRV